MSRSERTLVAAGVAGLGLYLMMRSSSGKTSLGPITQTQTDWQPDAKAEGDHRNALDKRATALMGVNWETGMPTRYPIGPETDEIRSAIAVLSQPPRYYSPAQAAAFQPHLASDLREHLANALQLPIATNQRPIKEYNA